MSYSGVALAALVLLTLIAAAYMRVHKPATAATPGSAPATAPFRAKPRAKPHAEPRAHPDDETVGAVADRLRRLNREVPVPDPAARLAAEPEWWPRSFRAEGDHYGLEGATVHTKGLYNPSTPDHELPA